LQEETNTQQNENRARDPCDIARSAESFTAGFEAFLPCFVSGIPALASGLMWVKRLGLCVVDRRLIVHVYLLSFEW
jgi:hypothetical protein